MYLDVCRRLVGIASLVLVSGDLLQRIYRRPYAAGLAVHRKAKSQYCGESVPLVPAETVKHIWPLNYVRILPTRGRVSTASRFLDLDFKS